MKNRVEYGILGATNITKRASHDCLRLRVKNTLKNLDIAIKVRTC
jgi:hypothetical protein